MRRRLRLYCDTSVFGGCFDEEFSTPSRRIFEMIRDGEFGLVMSRTTIDELNRAPEHVRSIVQDLPAEAIELVEVTPEVESLCEFYLAEGIVGRASRNDALHIAAASTARADMIVSWNFKHIVHFDKIRGYHGVNVMNGYPPIPIFSPLEVI